MTAPTQTEFPFVCDEAKLNEFLTRALAIEQEQDRLREDLRELKEEYQDFFPMRGVLAAIKIARTEYKAFNHPKEPIKPVHLAVLVHYVEMHMRGLALAMEAITRLGVDGAKVLVDMTTGEVTHG